MIRDSVILLLRFGRFVLRYEIDRAVLALVEDSSQILTDDAQRQQLRATKEQHDHHDGGIAPHRFPEEERTEEHIYHVKEGKQRAEQSQHGGYAEGRGGVGADALNGQFQQAPEVEGRLANHSVGLLEEHLLLPEAYPAIHALGVTLRLTQLPERVDTLPVQKAEIAYVLQNVNIGHLLQQPVI